MIVKRSAGQSWSRTERKVRSTIGTGSPQVGTMMATSGSSPWRTGRCVGMLRCQLQTTVSATVRNENTLATTNGHATNGLP